MSMLSGYRLLRDVHVSWGCQVLHDVPVSGVLAVPLCPCWWGIGCYMMSMLAGYRLLRDIHVIWVSSVM